MTREDYLDLVTMLDAAQTIAQTIRRGAAPLDRYMELREGLLAQAEATR